MQDFEGRVAVVTGAASGIGRSLAERFAREGMRVVLADIDERSLDEAVAAIGAAGHEAIGVVTDVRRAEAIEALRDRALEAFGAVHVLCNNAGVAGDLDFRRDRDARLWSYPLSDWSWTFDINFWGVIHGIRAFVPLMIEQGGPGHVVNTASQAGLLGGANAGIYGATKHAVVRVTEALYLQLVRDDLPVRASVLCPGIIKTRIYSSGRNRPADVTEGAAPPDLEAQARAADELWARDGLHPDEVAEQTLRAIRDEQLYVLTRDVPLDAVRARTERIVTGVNPQPERPFRLER